ncbi:MAG TPA: tetratricopeptide repeat protein [Rickettsia endosymbiont of Bembidion nr. Transversale]|nr:tetratricopeptide repeat protein [Rickettsia endosymbiont of Bembidion nr. Transversale]
MRKNVLKGAHKKYNKLWNKAGRCLDHQQYMQAIELYKKVIKIYPNSDAAYCNMGISFEYLKQYETAISCYDKAISVNPDDHHAYHNKALCLASLGHEELALEYYGKTMELNPKRYEDIYYEATKKADEEIDTATRAEMEAHITEEMEQYINQGGVLN